MASNPGSHISLAELQYRIQAVEPAAMLLEPRILRRVIKQDRRLTGLGLNVPHRKSYTIPADRLLVIVDRSELDLPPAADLPDLVILLAKPDDDEDVSSTAADQVLYGYSRLLFHARIHVELLAAAGAGNLGDEMVEDRVREIGRAEFAEIEDVLGREDLLLPPRRPAEVYGEFAAIFLELYYFAPEELGWYFPSLRNIERMLLILGQDVRHAELAAACRLEGAASPGSWRDRSPTAWRTLPEPSTQRDPLQPSPPYFWRLLARAERAGAVGNRVQAAILRTRATELALPGRVTELRQGARVEIERLVQRLTPILSLSEADARQWSDVLAALTEPAARGFWVAEARLLHDIQNVCVEHERGVYSVDLLRWLGSWGRGPLRRPLPMLRDVLVAKHLRRAAERLAIIRLGEQQREQLAALITTAQRRVETVMRDRVRPEVENVLDRVGLTPQNVAERVARRKLVEELLDRIVERGFLTIGDLRDALSQNSLKLPDLSGVYEFIFGDRLLRADLQLADGLDGVYRRGAVYLRLPQRLSSLAFGTKVGRFLTRYVALPYGGAYLGIDFLRHVVHSFTPKELPPNATRLPPPDYQVADTASVPATPPVAAAASDVRLPEMTDIVDPLEGVPAAEPTFSDVLESIAEGQVPDHGPVAASDPWMPLWVLLLGTFLLLLLHNTTFRRVCIDTLRNLFVLLRRVLVELPAQLLQSKFIQRILDSQAYKLIRAYIVKPLVFSSLLLLPAYFWNREISRSGALNVFLAINLFLNSPIGRYFDEWLTDLLVRSWRELQVRVFSAAFQLVMDLFSQLLEGLERVLYSVDEWLRFRSGDPGSFLAVKALLGTIWAVINYVTRIYATLLIEPQVNPIKHFPVVTVSHKMMLPWLPMFTHLLATPLEPFLGNFLANALAAITVFLLPGVFGFVVWELKENWRLYAANRRRRLAPTLVGHHGETLVGLLRPGFHSGSLPRLFGRLRRAARKSRVTGRNHSLLRQQARLSHYEHDVRHFVDREFLALLSETASWRHCRLEVDQVRLATNRLEVKIRQSESERRQMTLVFEERSGWLTAVVVDRDWFAGLNGRQSQTLVAALSGIYKYAGVDLVLEQLVSAFAPLVVDCEFSREGITARIPGIRPAFYRLVNDADWITPAVSESSFRWPTWERNEVVFASRSVSWSDWVDYWEQEQLGDTSSPGWLSCDRIIPLDPGGILVPHAVRT